MCLLPPSLIFFFNDTATTEIYTLSLHDALPISKSPRTGTLPLACARAPGDQRHTLRHKRRRCPGASAQGHLDRSEEHTSELQSRLHLVCRLLLEKKKKKPLEV